MLLHNSNAGHKGDSPCEQHAGLLRPLGRRRLQTIRVSRGEPQKLSRIPESSRGDAQKDEFHWARADRSHFRRTALSGCANLTAGNAAK